MCICIPSNVYEEICTDLTILTIPYMHPVHMHYLTTEMNKFIKHI